MTPQDLSLIGAGFSDQANGSQSVFRAALQALSYPGQIVDVRHDAQVPALGNSASAALLLALLDSDCSLWLSPTLAADGAIAAWLRFHTGCRLVDTADQAQFAWCAHLAELPVLSHLMCGTDVSPEQSTTCMIDVPGMSNGVDAGHWQLSGPGIQSHHALQLQGVPEQQAQTFTVQWANNHSSFPRGVDVFLCSTTAIVGLPRTTQIVPSTKA